MILIFYFITIFTKQEDLSKSQRILSIVREPYYWLTLLALINRKFVSFKRQLIQMGNKILRPNDLEPFSGFNDDQIGYLRDKFELLSDQNQLLSVQKISSELQTSSEQASKILNYIDFEGHQSVDFYEFVCAAASLHQNDSEAREFIFEIYAVGGEMDERCFQQFYSTVFRYLKHLNIISEEYSSQVGSAKFKQYDYNHNEQISFDEFESMLQNDYHCRMWMQTLGFAAESPPEVKEKVLNQEIARQDDQFQAIEEEGEQFQATNAWTKVCDQMCPLAPGEKSTPNQTPNINLDISYVYGYRSYDTRDNLKYNAQGEAVYHTAACGIILNKNKNTMRVNTAHNDDITCLDVNASKGLVVTGQMGRWPSLIVWDANTLETKAVFGKKLERNISNVAISSSGRYVAATSMSDKHQIAVYDLQKNSLLAFGQGPRSVIYAIKFNKQEDQLVCACQKQVVFTRFLNGKIDNKKGVFGKAPLNPNLAIANLGDSVVTSMTSGLLALWKGNFVTKVFKEHSKSVGALCERSQGGIVSGDALGNIILWSSTMSKERQISLQKLLGNVKSNNIRLIALSEQNGNILAGTRGGEVIQIQKGNQASVIMEGHFDQELWGLCVSNDSSRHEFFTGGQDKLLIKWDADKRKLVAKKKMEGPINSLDLNRQNILAVGLKSGIVTLLDGKSLSALKKISQHKNPDKDVLSAVKFSPDGSQLAVAYCPPISRVYLYDINSEKIKKLGECKGSSTRIVSIDFSLGGDLILATSIEPLFYKTPNCGQTFATAVKGQPWATMNSKYTWFTQGIWPPCSDGSDINFVDRSNCKKYLATADDYSKVKVFRYPVCNKRQLYNSYKGHSSHVTAVKWSPDDKLLFSTGGLEKSIIQWAVNKLDDYSYEIDEPLPKEEPEEEAEEYEFGDEQEAEDGDIGFKEEGGDQALAVKPFLGQVKASTPLGYRPTHKNEAPSQDLKVKHAWGVRNLYINDQVRNQVKYSSNGSTCLFITAALGVEMNLKTRQQTFYQGQSEDLISFAISRDGRYCATGQMAQLNQSKPTDKIVDVHVWDSQTKQLKAKLSKFHKRAIVLLQFSPTGKNLLTVGQDDKNSLAVYDWEVGRIAWSSPVDGAKVTAAAWKNETEYMTVGLKHAKFWNQGKGVLGKIPGKWDPMVSCVYWNDKFVTGGSSGNVYVWAGNTGNPSKGHEGAVDCLAIDSKGTLYSGCSKGIVMTWKFTGGKLAADKKICDVSKFDQVDPGVLSLDFFKERILLCTRSSSIYEFSNSQKNPTPEAITTGHCKGQLWAEAWSQDKLRFVTGGDDRTVRLWDSVSFRQLKLFKMKEQIRGLDWHHKGDGFIVVGDYKGKIYLFDSQLSLLDEAKTRFSKTKPRQEPFWIQDIKFSPDGKWIAFGAHGGASHVQIFAIEEGKFGAGKVINAGLTSALLSVDWSQDSQILAVVSQAYELKFLNVSGPVSASACRDVKWATWSGKFGFCVQEIHQDVTYSHINCVAMSPSRSLIATGSDDQKVRIFTYPVTIPKQKHKQFTGHSSHVTRVLFSVDQRRLLSVGGNDRTIILWDVIGAEDLIQEAEEQPEVDEEEEADEEAYEDAEEVLDIPRPREQKVKKEEKKEEEEDDFGLEEDEGDQFMAVKPWMGAIKEPTKPYYKGAGKPPRASCILSFAHGYRTKDCRNNLRYISEHEIAYHTAGLGIVMNIEDRPHTQQFFDSHNDDIISMCWSEDRTEMFTGQMGAKPSIFRWNKDTESITCYRGVKKGVSALAANTKYLVASGLDDNHYVFVFDLQKGTLLASEKGGREVILGLKWINDNSFVSVGLKHFKLWEFDGKSVKGSSGSFGKSNCNLVCSVEVSNQKVYTGVADGSILVWGGKSVLKSQKGHKGAVNALCIHEGLLLTGSNDQTIKIWAQDSLSLITTIDCGALLDGSVCKKIRALDAIGNRILVGTLGSEIFQLQSSDKIKNTKEGNKFRVLSKDMSGHFAPNFVTNEVWGLGWLDQTQYMTCSDDGTLRVWDSARQEQVTWTDLKFDEKLKPLLIKENQKFLPDSVHARCLAVSSNGEVVIGCKDGTVRILDNGLRPTWCKRVSQKQISHIKFSPDGNILAIGAHDGRIYLFEWNEGAPKPKKGKAIKHNSYIKHFDFSRDGNWIHSTCGAYELLFWDVSTGAQITSGATMSRDEEWATWNVTLGWPVQGIWEPFMDGTDINAVDRSNSSYAGDMKVLATGDDHGKVRLLEYPCVVKNSQGVVGRGHSSHVTNVKFSSSDKLLISTGGEDQTIIQWEVEMDS